jgi:hypothetical protein
MDSYGNFAGSVTVTAKRPSFSLCLDSKVSFNESVINGIEQFSYLLSIYKFHISFFLLLLVEYISIPKIVQMEHWQSKVVSEYQLVIYLNKQ